MKILRTVCLVIMGLGACGPGGADSRASDASGATAAHAPDSVPVAAPTLELETAYPEPFSFLHGVRELSDGTVMVADPLSQVVLRIDMDAGTADTLGSVGPGPQEYREPDDVLTLTGDSTLLVDFGKTYLTVIDPNGSFVGGRSMTVPRETGFPGLLHPRFGDIEGRIYYQPSRSGGAAPSDSAAVIRFDMATRTAETAAILWFPEVEQIRSPSGGFLPRLLEPRDDWAAGSDGRVAVIRAGDYSVVWHHPDGRVVMGPPNPLEPLPLDRETREAYLPVMRSSGITMWSASSQGAGEVRMGMSRGLSRDGPGVDDFEWAETLPIFRPDRTRISMKGEAWVERWLPPDSTARMDVFHEDGTLTGPVPLPTGRQLLAFGRGPGGEEVAYLVRTDEFDLMWLERYRVVRNRTGRTPPGVP